MENPMNDFEPQFPINEVESDNSQAERDRETWDEIQNPKD